MGVVFGDFSFLHNKNIIKQKIWKGSAVILHRCDKFLMGSSRGYYMSRIYNLTHRGVSELVTCKASYEESLILHCNHFLQEWEKIVTLSDWHKSRVSMLKILTLGKFSHTFFWFVNK